MDFYRLKWAITLWILSTNSSDILWELKSTLFYVHDFVVEKVITAFFRMRCSFFIWWPFMAILAYLHKRTSKKPVFLRYQLFVPAFITASLWLLLEWNVQVLEVLLFFLKEKKYFFLRFAEMLWFDTKFHSNAFIERVWIFSVESFLATGWTIVGIWGIEKCLSLFVLAINYWLENCTPGEVDFRHLLVTLSCFGCLFMIFLIRQNLFTCFHRNNSSE